MTEYVAGKRYRVSVDAVYVTHYLEPYFCTGGGDMLHLEDNHGLTAELIKDPLPTTRGSVIKSDFGLQMEFTAVLGMHGNWYDNAGEVSTAAEIQEYPWTLIYDAGAVK